MRDLKILLVSYGDLDYDGRLRSLLKVFEDIGELYSFTRGQHPVSKNGITCNASYLKFIRKAVQYAKHLDRIDVLVLDNRKATIPGLLIQKYASPYTILDCRELYLLHEVKHFAGKVGCLFEKKMARKADTVICANSERAEIMMHEYGLKDLPLTYENLRSLEYTSEENAEKAEARLSKYMKDDERRILSSSGCSIQRTNDILVKNLKRVNTKCRLFLVGNSSKEDEKTIKELAANDALNEVTILGQLNQDELKYLISQCHIGIVNYGQYDTNNRLCASGKLYEFIYEGIPVVTTTNPPLKRICDSEGIGVADDDYYEGINTILSNYEEYKSNVLRYSRTHTIKDNDAFICAQLSSRIRSRISKDGH